MTHLDHPDSPEGAADEPESGAPPDEPKRRRRPLAIDLLAVGALLALLAYLHTRVVRVALVTSGSMMTTVNPGDRLLIHLGAYKDEPPQRGDVIAFWHDDPGDYEVKRVVAVGGDTIVVGWGLVFLNGQILDEPYIRRPMLLERRVEAVLADGELFVMGDNRNSSGDSRDFGSIYEEKVLGRVFQCILPLERIGPVERAPGTPRTLGLGFSTSRTPPAPQ